ncbi:MAG: hypothetical protein H6Q32_770, partial [Bacteroidetes bacterium]|nr:hypothetical protein [Bacteroidota bacterium]
MDAKQTKIVFGAVLLVALIWLMAPLLGRRAEAPGAAEHIRPLFDAT